MKKSFLLVPILFLLCLAGSVLAQSKYTPSYLANKDESFNRQFRQMTDYGWLFFRDEPDAAITAEDFLAKYSKNLGITEGYELKIIRDESEKIEESKSVMRHQVYQLFYKGVLVEKNELRLHSTNGVLKIINGKITTGIEVNTSKTMDSRTALLRALDKQKLSIESFADKKLPEGQLVIAGATEDFTAENYRLVFAFDLTSEKIDNPYRVYVDATSGEIVKSVPLFANCTMANHKSLGNHSHTKKSQSIIENPLDNSDATTPLVASTFQPNYSRYLNGQSSLTFETDQAGATYRLSAFGNNLNTRIDANNNGAWNGNADIFNASTNWSGANRNATTAHWLVQEVHNMYQYLFLRNGFNNSGSYPKVLVQWDANNAQWLGNLGWIRLGHSPFGSSLVTADVLGHEYTHGVVQYTANLGYGGESGALNESISDIFGTTLEFHLFGPGANYEIGEDADQLRSMSNPLQAFPIWDNYGQPDQYQGTNWFNTSGCTPNDENDFCGVHTNSGVMNKWYWYMRTGGPTGTPLDYQKPARSVYRALQFYLSSGSSYNDAMQATVQGAVDVYGACSDIARQASYAWSLVGIQNITPCTDCNFTMSASAAPSPVQCSSPVTLTANCVGSGCNHINSFQWTGNGLNQYGKSITINSPSTSGTTSYNLSTVKLGCLLNVSNVSFTTQCSSCDFNVSAATSNGNPNGGSPVTLTANCTGSNCSNVSYTWSGNGVSQSGSQIGISAPTTPGTYTYTVTASRSGCSSKTATVSIQVGTTPQGTCIGLSDLCSGNSQEIRSYTINLASGGTYPFKLTYRAHEGNSTGLMRINGGAWQSFSLAQTGVSQYVETTIGNFNLNSGNNTIEFASGSLFICFRQLCVGSGGTPPSCDFNVSASNSNSNPNAGAPVTLTASCSGANCGDVSYSWSGNGVSQSGSQIGINAPSGTGVYTYTVSAVRPGCSAKTASTTIQVGTVQPNCTSLGDQCSGNSQEIRTYTVSSSGGSFTFKLTYRAHEGTGTGLMRINGGAWQSFSLPQTSISQYVETTIGNYSLNAGNNTVEFASGSGYICFRQLCTTSGARMVSGQEFIPGADMRSLGIVASPNPNNGKFDIEFYVPPGQPATLSVTNKNGTELISRSLKGKGNHREHLEINQSNAGLIIIQIRTSERILTKKVVVTN